MYVSEAIIPITFILVMFGMVYLYLSTRNKERLALIEKGATANIFGKSNNRNPAPFWKVFILNLSLLLMGIGVGIITSLMLESILGIEEDAIYAGTIFLTAGAGLFVGFNMTKKLDQE